jgi:hypothetical protein
LFRLFGLYFGALGTLLKLLLQVRIAVTGVPQDCVDGADRDG